MNATNPISLAGIQLPELKSQLPRRIATNHLVYHGSDLVLVSERNGSRLQINKAADDPDILDYFVSLKHLLYRSFRPLNQLRIELINDEPAIGSAYLTPLGTTFDLLSPCGVPGTDSSDCCGSHRQAVELITENYSQIRLTRS